MIAFCELRDTEYEYFQNQFGEEHIYTSEELGTQLDNREQIDTVSVFVNSEVSKEVIDAYPNLKHITTRSTGYNHIDIEHANKQGVTVSHVPAYGSESVAEYAFALLLSLVRNVHTGYHQMREHDELGLDGLQGITLANKKIGIVGTGAIGAQAVKIAHGFGMDISAYDPQPNQHLVDKFGVAYKEELSELLSAVDVVSLHVPLNEQTHHLIDEESFQTMKDTAYLINTARGGVVDTVSLVKAIKSDQIAGAGLDVLEQESSFEQKNTYSESAEIESVQTILADHELIELNNVLVTPHIGFYTENAEKEIMQITTDNIQSYYENGNPSNGIAQ